VAEDETDSVFLAKIGLLPLAIEETLHAQTLSGARKSVVRFAGKPLRRSAMETSGLEEKYCSGY
jgi:hypothetical protein